MSKSFSMTVQLPLTGKWGTEDEKERFGQVYEALTAAFEASGSGDFDGHDWGSGTVNFFIYSIRPERWEEALQLALDTVKKHGLLDKAIVAKGEMASGEEEGELVRDVVVWPQDFKGKFSVLNFQALSGESVWGLKSCTPASGVVMTGT